MNEKLDKMSMIKKRTMNLENNIQGILLINKPSGKTSFSLISTLRKILGVKTIGHTGTLDPFATGVMILLIGRSFTRLCNVLINQNKEYCAELHLGIETETYDPEGKITQRSDLIPTHEEIEICLKNFQGEIEQIPPMFSAKKINGKKLYELARKGKIIERQPALITIQTTLNNYTYPFLNLTIQCSKGTYIRSLAHDVGQDLKCYAHLSSLTRIRSGPFHLAECIDGSLLPSLSKQFLKEKMDEMTERYIQTT